MLNDCDFSTIRQVGRHGAAHFQPNLIVVAANIAGAACGIDVRINRNDTNPGGDGFLCCFRAAVIVCGREDHNVRFILRHLPNHINLFVNVNFSRRG